jgi:hypothetical protein
MSSCLNITQIIILTILILVLLNNKPKEKLTFYIEPFPGTEALLNKNAQITNTESNEIKEQKLKWCKSSKENINDRLKSLFNSMDIKYTNNPKKCNFYIPYWYSDDELTEFVNKNYRPNMILNVIPGVDYLNRKHKLWNALVTWAGRKKASQLMPSSYAIYNDEWKYFEKDFKKGNYYLLKTEEENAQGIFVYNNIDQIKEKVMDKNLKFPVTIIQRFIEPLLIKDRTFKLRLFLFIKCRGGKKELYIHKQGGVFYAKEKFNPRKLTYENIVANAYWFNQTPVDKVKQFLKEHPRNLVQLKKYFKNTNVDGEKLFSKIHKLLKVVASGLKDKICTVSKLQKNIKVGLFGIDIIVDKNLKPWLIEMNVSPSSTAFDQLGEKQKQQVWVDTIKITLLKNPKEHQFELL